MADEYVIVLTTMPVDADAEALGRTLVGEELAACVNVLPPMVSIYRWEGHVAQASERQIVIKTLRGRVGALRDRLHGLHPYDVPEFVVLAIVAGSDRYLQWISESVGREDPRT